MTKMVRKSKLLHFEDVTVRTTKESKESLTRAEQSGGTRNRNEFVALQADGGTVTNK